MSSQTADSGSTPNTQVTRAATHMQAAGFALVCAMFAELLLVALAGYPFHRFSLSQSLGRVLALFFSMFILHRFARSAFRAYKPNLKNLSCLYLLLVCSIIIVWVGRFIAASLSSYLSSLHIPAEAYWFAVPYAAGALVMQAVLGLHYGLVFSLALSFILSIYSLENFPVMLFVLSTCLTACLSLSSFRSRSAYLKAGFNIAAVSFLIALCVVLMQGKLISIVSLATLLCALLGPILCAFIASGATPIVEYLGGYVTDMRLIEMATLDHPLLKELSVQAPGTWNHCMVMGMMVESAADGIGANPVLSRVGAYFHDIGKTKKPLYFVENQNPGENRHDKLSTSMSALIIRSHVKDGIELARKHGLPKVIEDMIPQHHGTSRIEYFYEKACKEVEEAGEDAAPVDESLYRYPGPKPQTKEAGILMLADGIEAAARTLSDPSFDRIQGMVQKLINKVFASGELDECDLTLKDLHTIAKSFTRVLSGIYHQRIAYAEPVEKIRDSSEGEEAISSETESGEVDAQKAKASSEERPAKDKELEKENLKRLGL